MAAISDVILMVLRARQHFNTSRILRMRNVQVFSTHTSHKSHECMMLCHQKLEISSLFNSALLEVLRPLL